MKANKERNLRESALIIAMRTNSALHTARASRATTPLPPSTT